MILCIETTSLNCSVALVDNGRVVDVHEKRESGYTHAESLHVFIDELLKRNKLEPRHLKAVAVSEGPGSYTGLRIGVSCAKGFCFALNIPLISVSTLHMMVLALEAAVEFSHIIPMIDARRMEVYMQVFTQQGKALSEVEAKIIDASFLMTLAPGTLIFGEGAEKFEEILPPHVSLLKGVFPSAKDMSQIATQRLQEGVFEDLAYFEPLYLKEFMAGPKKGE